MIRAIFPCVSRQQDERIRELSEALRNATRDKKWDVVKALNVTLRAAMAQRRKAMPQAQRDGIRRGNAATRAYDALEDAVNPGAPVLAAMATDERYGSLRAWCDVRQENRSSMSAYLSGRLAMPDRVLQKLRRDFPELEWTPPQVRPGQIGRPRKSA